MSRHPFPFSLFSFAWVLMSGCATHVETVIEEGNYRTYEHAFSDAAAEAVRRTAEKSCAGRKRVAVKTSSTCSLNRCTTHYQCVDKADAARFK